MANSFVIATEEVRWGQKERAQVLTVRGLSYQDFMVLFTTFGKGVDQVLSFIDASSKGGKVPDDFDLKEFGMGMIGSSPQVVALLIALAADLPSNRDDVARMPLPAQIDALEKIYELTVTEAGGLADFLALVSRIARNVTKATHSLRSNQAQMEAEITNEKHTGS